MKRTKSHEGMEFLGLLHIQMDKYMAVGYVVL
jgi:hypothetical protein